MFARYIEQVKLASKFLAVLGGLVFAVSPAMAQPAVITMVMQPPASIVAMASATSLCITITYDKNGNRISQTVGNVTTNTTIWGSGTYGCFVWKP
jgi:hypothetical protein